MLRDAPLLELCLTWRQLADSGGEDNAADGTAEPAEQKTIFDESLKCTMCMELCNRPITVSSRSCSEELKEDQCFAACLLRY